MTDEPQLTDLREKLAAVQHNIWMHWISHMLSVSLCNADGTYTIPSEFVDRWQRQAQTAYKDLSDDEKDSDRELADLILGVIQQEQYG